MQITRNSVVAFDYTLTDDAGAVIDTSSGREPLQYLHGHGNIVPGLEGALEGRQVGDEMKVSVPAGEGYGEHDSRRVMRVGRDQLPDDLSPEVGMQLGAHGPDGQVVPLWITAIDDTAITLDGNHPLAGKTLHFAVAVRAIRAATDEELAHGHPHGPGGHHH